MFGFISPSILMYRVISAGDCGRALARKFNAQYAVAQCMHLQVTAAIKLTVVDLASASHI